MVGQPDGYLMVGEDGGIFAFGKVAFKGSLGANPPPARVLSVAAIGDPPVLEFQRVFEQSGVGAVSTSTFQLTTNVARLSWSCAQPSGYSAGCHFVVKDFHTGDQISSGYVSTNPGQNGVLLLHPDHAGTYYIETDTYTSAHDDAWAVSVDQQRCVQNCG